MSKRIKLKGPSVRTRPEAESAMERIRSLSIEKLRLQAEREEAIKDVDEQFSDRVNLVDAEINALTQSMSIWASDNVSEFGKSKTLELAHGKIGWHTHPWSVKQLSGWKLEDTINAALEIPSFRDRFVRKTPELNKLAIINARGEVPPEELARIGVKVRQECPFFVEPKLEDSTTRITEAE